MPFLYTKKKNLVVHNAHYTNLFARPAISYLEKNISGRVFNFNEMHYLSKKIMSTKEYASLKLSLTHTYTHTQEGGGGGGGGGYQGLTFHTSK